MFAKTYGGSTLGVDGLIINVEVDTAPGLPCMEIVGLPAAAVKESKERVRTAVRNSGFDLQAERVTINLAPADIRKDSSGLDLPIAIALLISYGIMPAEVGEKALFAAELSLEGDCRPVKGILAMVVAAREREITNIFVARENANEALLVDGVTVYSISTLAELAAHLTGQSVLSPATPQVNSSVTTIAAHQDDFSDVQGQFIAKRALEIAAAGGHNLLMSGIPGSGKTMLARRLSTILPELTKEEALEVTKIYSVAGLLPSNGELLAARPFRAPHHTASTISLIGGGAIPRPGEVTLAHHGVLFLDELPEFGKSALEILRQPLEDRRVTISRISATLTFPSNLILICAMNPCPCGYFGDKDHPCQCTPGEIKRYQQKISGPLLDRIDLRIRVPKVEYSELASRKKAEASAVIRARVVAARQRQLERLKPYGIFCNAQMNHSLIQNTCHLSDEAQTMLEIAFNQMNLSARSYDRIIKVARTIADLDRSDIIEGKHIAEAIQLRNDGNSNE